MKAVRAHEGLKFSATRTPPFQSEDRLSAGLLLPEEESPPPRRTQDGDRGVAV
jgi:hypothetical protein